MNLIMDTGTHNTTATARTIKYIVIHYTAGTTSKRGAARNTAAWFKNPKAGGSADYIVDDEEFVQYNPDPKSRYCWAVGGSKYDTHGGSLYKVATNRNCVSIEICSTKQGDVYTFTAAVVNNAIELTKYLMQVYGVDADHVIRHWDVNGKPCPDVYGWNPDTGSNAEWGVFKSRIGGSVQTVTIEPKQAEAKTETGAQSRPASSGSDRIRLAQAHMHNFVDGSLEADGIRGPKTNRAVIMTLQRCLDLDYNAGLAIDGKAGPKTYAALGKHYVRQGEKQYLVSFVEVALSVLNYDTGGVEFPGIFGTGLHSAVTVFQHDAGLTADGIAGYRTIRALIGKIQ